MTSNEPAFPLGCDAAREHETGMSLRDYFAGQAIASIPIRNWDHLGKDADIITAWARCAYAIADAMLLARSPQERENG
jgi:hypothetical protein